ncbi:MAG: HAD family phosphatase [Saprospiraceae bacterium]
MIKNIIFDFGNVLLNLDESRTFNGLKEVLNQDLCIDINEEVFFPYERGEISEEAFFNRLQRRSKKVLQGDVYYEIWNSMLLDFPIHRLNFLVQLRPKYKLILLSNTNITHARNVLRIMRTNLGIKNLEDYFDHVYLSHDVHLRKPDPAIYKLVLKDAGIVANESLFFDDKLENTESAAMLGIQVHHHNPEQDITEIFDEVVSRNNV